METIRRNKMKSFISSSKNVYYEATTALDPSDVEVPQRPSPNHSYVNGVWIDQTLIPAQSFQQIASPVPIASAQSNLADLVNVIKQLQNINNSASTPNPPKKAWPKNDRDLANSSYQKVVDSSR